ncbi:MAG: hypothetical protein EXR73_05120 [Myxococcales bacterium]|nr:hypothetical protein [Myxococcales bacterium]
MIRVLPAPRLALALATLVTALPATLHAQPSGGPTSTVEILIEPAAQTKAPSARREAYVERLANPVLAPTFDPSWDCFVYLEGTAPSPELRKAPDKPLTWRLSTGALSPAVLPVVAGTRVELHNAGHRSHRVGSTGSAAVPTTTLAPGEKLGLPLVDAATPLALHFLDAPDVAGRIVALPTRLFATADRKDSRFRITGVPSGKWRVRVYYRDAWLELPAQVEVTVDGRPVSAKVTLPALLPGDGGEAQ